MIVSATTLNSRAEYREGKFLIRFFGRFTWQKWLYLAARLVVGTVKGTVVKGASHFTKALKKG